jgi:gluconate 2-dehydrogenase gamma chain
MTASDPSVFGDDELSLLTVLIDLMMPADDYGPGALDAQVLTYIERALADELVALLPAYRGSLQRVEQHVRTQHSARLADASPEVQQSVIGDLAEDRIAGAEGFFLMLRTHVIEGFLGDPARGGNADGIGWQTIGYPGPRQVVTVEQQQLGYRPPLTMHSAYDLLGPRR